MTSRPLLSLAIASAISTERTCKGYVVGRSCASLYSNCAARAGARMTLIDGLSVAADAARKRARLAVRCGISAPSGIGVPRPASSSFAHDDRFRRLSPGSTVTSAAPERRWRRGAPRPYQRRMRASVRSVCRWPGEEAFILAWRFLLPRSPKRKKAAAERVATAVQPSSRERDKLLKRARRLAGQADAIERAILANRHAGTRESDGRDARRAQRPDRRGRSGSTWSITWSTRASTGTRADWPRRSCSRSSSRISSDTPYPPGGILTDRGAWSTIPVTSHRRMKAIP